MSHYDMHQLFSNANMQINNLLKWFCANKLSLNARKIKFIVIRPNDRHFDITGLNTYIDNTM